MYCYTWFASLEAAKTALGLASIFDLLDSSRYDLIVTALDGVAVCPK